MSKFTIDVTDATFDNVLFGSEVPALVDFWASWCGPCKAVAPILEEIAEARQGELRVLKYNTEQNRRVMEALGVRSLPTLVLMRGQKVEAIHVGAAPRGKLDAWIDQTLNPKPGLLSRLFGKS
jgi:thioredoxin 1